MSQALNDPSAPQSVARAPRARLLLAGQPCAGLLSCEVVSTNNYHADTLRAEFALNVPGAQPLSFWGTTDKITLDIQVSTDGGDASPAFQTLQSGQVDHIEVDAFAGLVTIEGRDLSAQLIDAKTAETFQNQTSSQVATILAQRHGLTAVVTATTTPVSRYYSVDHDHMTGDSFNRSTTEWDLLVYLAQLEGFDVFVQGQSLHFQPVASSTQPPYVVRCDFSGAYPVANVMTMRLERSLTLASDIEVWVRSWSPGSKSGFTVKAVGKSSGGATPQRHVVVRPNLTRAQAQALANSIRTDLTRKERLLTVELPGGEAPSARDLVLLQGTGTSWDQVYYVDTITRRFSPSEGYSMTVACKNHSPANESLPG